MAQRLSEEVEADIVARWEGGCSVLREIAVATGVHSLTVRHVLERNGVQVSGNLRHDGGNGSPNKVAYTPTPEEIRRDAALIRDGWTEGLERKRRGASDEPYTIPIDVPVPEDFK